MAWRLSKENKFGQMDRSFVPEFYNTEIEASEALIVHRYPSLEEYILGLRVDEVPDD
jgi:hypothetical protein